MKVHRKVDWELESLIFCEVKAGDASFERAQRLDMQTVAEVHEVLKIRMLLEQLPAEYTARIHRVLPNEE